MFAIKLILFYLIVCIGLSNGLDRSCAASPNESLFIPSDERIFLNILNSVKPPENLSYHQILRWKQSASKGSYSGVSDCTEYYPVDHTKYIDYVSLGFELKLFLNNEKYSELETLIGFQFTYIIQKEYNDRFVSNTMFFDKPVNLTKSIDIYKNQSYYPLNYGGYYGHWKWHPIYRSDYSPETYKYPNENGVIIWSDDNYLVFIRPVIALDLRFIEK